MPSIIQCTLCEISLYQYKHLFKLQITKPNFNPVLYNSRTHILNQCLTNFKKDQIGNILSLWAI